MPRQLWHERRSRHARLRIHFEADQFTGSAGGVVKSEIGSRYAAAAQSLMRLKR
jgi:hypothetical protein